ncbi:hypothetical protein [Parabacteroides sp. AM08-6]|uniref:hypothetical protein n=1 Tax=Parabacteroides sp. AM08-6 TaxID=2292053 RepID=UPI000EFFE828|nr:hypothetical protein [Parabacteroides sp. AM08-6]RHJ77091.1 hypothetical protein DW103_16215 [Parabacteroides sp. AM08-6]
MAGIMKTLWDESSELENETLSTRSVLTDDYTSNDVQKLKDTVEDEKENEDIIDDTIEEL